MDSCQQRCKRIKQLNRERQKGQQECLQDENIHETNMLTHRDSMLSNLCECFREQEPIWRQTRAWTIIDKVFNNKNQMQIANCSHGRSVGLLLGVLSYLLLSMICGCALPSRGPDKVNALPRPRRGPVGAPSGPRGCSLIRLSSPDGAPTG